MADSESRTSNLQPFDLAQGKSAIRNLLPPISLLLVGSLVLGAFALNAPGGVPLDDAWIHFQFARNLARGDGFSFNPNQPTAGSTAPLWTLLLAGVYLLGGRFPVAGQALSGVCFLATLLATYALGRQLTGSRWLAWLAGMVVAANGRMVWAGLSALETCLFTALSLAAIGLHLRGRAPVDEGKPVGEGKPRPYSQIITAALFGLAALARPEGYLLFAIALADFTFHVSRSTVHGARNTQHTIRVACCVLCSTLVFAAIVLPYLLFSLKSSGHLLPNTYHAKAAVSLLPDCGFVSLAARYLILDNPLLLPFVLLGGLLLLRRAPLVSLWSVGLPLAYAFLHATLYQHGRYLIPLIPCNTVLGSVGLLEMRRILTTKTQRAQRIFSRPGVLCALSALAVIGTAWRLPVMASQYAWNVDNINAMHVALGEWIKDNTPPGALLALNDIGAIAYISERPIIDLAGLVTPEVVPLLHAPDRDARLAEYLTGRDVQYVVIFPNWFPGLAASDELAPLYQVTLERNTIAGGQTMVVYRAHWRR
jgi:hypothetical protein